ncbi:ABC transporter ATP-binding protein [Tabrizicola sp.]|uniref:ABC transporter ATP-binding protein n=1 Tax=Tabrizicola sp. TaxID=2005166 RepID=UPI003F307E9C
MAEIEDPVVDAPEVEVRGLVKSYPGSTVPVLDGLTIRCPAASATVVVGPSGCGKSTLLRCISGLDAPGAGHLHFGGRDVTNVDAARRGVAMVFQNYALYPDKTVAENIAFPLRMIGLSRDNRTARVLAAARLVRIDALLDRRPAQLSGGQRQRVGIARAIVRRPDVLLMDEPLSNLDTKLRTEMRAELAALHRKLGATMIYVTHDQTEALTLADHLVVLNAGRVAQEGRPEPVFLRPANTFVAEFLGRMNLLPVRSSGPPVLLANAPVAGWPASLAPPLTGTTVGFRAEDAQVMADRSRPQPDALHLSIKVEHVELMGTDRLLIGRSGDAVLRVRCPTALPLGETVAIAVEAKALHMFDVEGNRLP